MKLAVAYLRMSSAKQDTSIPDQWKAIKEYAKRNGYKITKKYTDEAISGDDTERRVEFQRMISDAASGAFGFIICWDASRFGRFDMIEGAFWIRPLRNAGVTLVTLDRGEISWTDFASRILWGIETEGRHSFLRDLARNSMRGKLSAAQQGIWLAGKPPLGYRLENGRLAIDESSAGIVRELFTEYLGGLSMWRMVDTLRAKGVKSPRGGQWSPSSLSVILRNEVYVGTYRWNRISEAKYVHLADGRCEEVKSKNSKIVHREEDWVVIENSHEPIIDREIFEAVQRELHFRRRRTTPNGSNNFLLTGLITCGQCGAPMHGRQSRGGKIRYQCSAYLKGSSSEANTVVQDEVLGFIIRLIRRKYCTAAGVAEFKKRAQQAVAIATDQGSREESVAALAAVNGKLEKAQRRLFEVEDDELPAGRALIAELREERARIERYLEAAAIDPESIMRGVEDACESYATLAGTLESRDHASMRVGLTKTLRSVSVTSERTPVGKISRHTLISCSINMRHEGAVFSSLSGHSERVRNILNPP